MRRRTQNKSLATSTQAGTSGAGHSKNIRWGRIDVAGLEHGERRRSAAHGTVLVLVNSQSGTVAIQTCILQSNFERPVLNTERRLGFKNHHREHKQTTNKQLLLNSISCELLPRCTERAEKRRVRVVACHTLALVRWVCG